MATAVSNPVHLPWRARKRLWALLGAGGVATVGLSAVSAWRDSHIFLVNASDSLPNWAFLIRRGEMPARGDFFFFDPPPSALLKRHFGAKPKMFGKIAYGVPGDVIAHDGTIVRVNGRPVARMKPRTKRGEPLTPGATGVVPPACYFAGTPHSDGFDSRYAEIGLICRRQIIGVGEALL